MQNFKTSDLMEQKFREAGLPVLNNLVLARQELFAGAYTCYALGDVLYITKASPMSGIITQENFRMGFAAIHDLFTRPGTFEFYMDVFRAIFGDSVQVEFTRPAPGKLLINVESLDAVEYPLLGRSIVDNTYIYDNVVARDGDLIVGQGTQGIKTQQEMDALMREITPAGGWIVTTLVIT